MIRLKDCANDLPKDWPETRLRVRSMVVDGVFGRCQGGVKSVARARTPFRDMETDSAR